MDFKKLKKGIDNRRIIKWPGSDESVCIRVLAESDFLKAEAHCDMLYKERGVNLGNIDERNAVKDSYGLYLAIVDNDGQRIFPDFDTFTEYATPEIRTELIAIQNAWQAECSPVLDEMPEAEMLDLLDAVKKNIAALENISDMRLLRKLIAIMVSRPQKSPMGS